MRLFAVLVPAALLAVAPVAAAETPAEATFSSTEAKPATTEKSAKPKKVCRLSAAATGSRLSGRRVCRTADEWEDLDTREADLGRANGVRAVPPPPRPGPGR